jgi:hypothetical protein
MAITEEARAKFRELLKRPKPTRAERRKAMSRYAQVFEYEERQYRHRLGDCLLCPECRRVNSHAGRCSRPTEIRLGPKARVPRVNAHQREWEALHRVFGRLEPLLERLQQSR